MLMRLPWEAKSKAVLQPIYRKLLLLLSAVYYVFHPHVLANVISKYFSCSSLVTSCVNSIALYALVLLILSM